uniref:Anticodon-binding domain-containing protein n=1 Tax=Sus scrofa TaxID=9823 RepID=A0A8D0P5U2_PIG
MSSLVKLHRRRKRKPSVAISSPEELQQKAADYSKETEGAPTQCQDCHFDDARDAREERLFQYFYQVIQKERDQERPSDCIIVFINKEQREYATDIGHRLQDHGLVVEMIFLASESDVTRALQEVKDDGSPFCILVEQSNVELCSCTVILLHKSTKVLRHIPLENALELVAEEHRRLFAKREQRDRPGISLRAGDLVDDFLARDSLTSYSVPSCIRYLLFLLDEGKHLYKNELDLLIDYLHTRKGQLEGCETPNPSASSDPPSFQGSNTPILGTRPPLLPTPGKNCFLGPPPAVSAKTPLLGDRPVGLLPRPGGLLPLPGLVHPNGLFPPPLPPAAPSASSKRPAPLRRPPSKPAKRSLLGEKPGLLPPPPGNSLE